MGFDFKEQQNIIRLYFANQIKYVNIINLTEQEGGKDTFESIGSVEAPEIQHLWQDLSKEKVSLVKNFENILFIGKKKGTLVVTDYSQEGHVLKFKRRLFMGPVRSVNQVNQIIYLVQDYHGNVSKINLCNFNFK